MHASKKQTPRVLAAVAAVLLTLQPLAARAEIRMPLVDLVPATPTENTFDFTVSALAFAGMDTVTYQGILRPVLDIDFSNINQPVISTMNFAGQAADIVHSDSTVDFGSLVGNAQLLDVLSCVVTFPASVPAPVSPTGNPSVFSFSSIDHEIIFGSGRVEVNPTFATQEVVDLSTDPLRRSLGGTDDSTVSLTLNNIAGNVATYDLEIFVPLIGVNVETDNQQINDLIDIVVDGNLVARSQITQVIPEPTGCALAALAGALTGFRGRRV